jgi:putative transposase
MINSLCITPSPGRGRGNGPETRPGIEPSVRGDVIPNLPALTGTLAIHGGEEVRSGVVHMEPPPSPTLNPLTLSN